jgi:hypothetical protein
MDTLWDKCRLGGQKSKQWKAHKHSQWELTIQIEVSEGKNQTNQKWEEPSANQFAQAKQPPNFPLDRR